MEEYGLEKNGLPKYKQEFRRDYIEVPEIIHKVSGILS